MEFPWPVPGSVVSPMALATVLFPVLLRLLGADRSFVAGMGSGLASETIGKTVLDLARSLDLHVVAEGIETIESAERFRALRCSTGDEPLTPPSSRG